MAILVSHKRHPAVRCGLLIVLTWMVTSSAVFAQSSSGLGNAIFALRRIVAGDQTDIDGRLYAATIVATITNRDGNTENFTDADTMRRFSITPIRTGAAPLTFPGGNSVSFPTAAGYSDTVAAIAVAMNGGSGVETAEFTISFSDSALSVDTPLSAVSSQRLNYDEVANGSATSTDALIRSNLDGIRAVILAPIIANAEIRAFATRCAGESPGLQWF